MKQDTSREIITILSPNVKPVPGAAEIVAKSETSNEDTPLPVETMSTNSVPLIRNCAKITGNVETNCSDKNSEHVETSSSSKASPVTTTNRSKNTEHVETDYHVSTSQHKTSKDLTLLWKVHSM